MKGVDAIFEGDVLVFDNNHKNPIQITRLDPFYKKGTYIWINERSNLNHPLYWTSFVLAVNDRRWQELTLEPL